MAKKNEESFASLLENADEVKKMARFLYDNVEMRQARQLSKRVDYFRGKKLIDCLLAAKATGKKGAPKIANEEDAISIGRALLKFDLIHASKVKNKANRELIPVIDEKNFTEDGYYTWIYQPSSFKSKILLGAFISIFLAFVMFPVWPQPMKLGIWYICVTLLVLFFSVVVVRGVLFLLLWMVGFDFWLFPRFFDDEASIRDSFIPIVTLSVGDQSVESWLQRSFGAVCVAALAVYVYNQPTEFDEIMVIQREFMQGLYDGTLLSDESHKSEDFLDRAVPDLESLKKELEEEELLESLSNDIESDTEAAEDQDDN